MHAQTLTDELARGTIAATGQLLGNILIEVLTQGDAGVLHLSLLIQGLNPIIPNIGIYLINICILIEQNSEKFGAGFQAVAPAGAFCQQAFPGEFPTKIIAIYR